MGAQPAPPARGSEGGAIAAMLFAALISMYDRSTLPPMLATIADGLDTSIGEVGAALSVFAIAYAVSQLPWSIVSSRLGQVRVLRLALGLGAVAAIATAAATDPALLWLGRILAGVSIGAIVPATLVYVGDTVPTARRGHVLANMATATSLGMTIAVVVASALGSIGAWRWVFIITAVAELVVLVLLLRVPAGPRPESRRAFLPSVGRVLSDGWVLLVLGLVMLEGIMLIGVMGFLPTALQREGTGLLLAGVVTGVYGVTLILTAQLMKPALGRVPAPALLAIGGGATALAFALIAVSTTVVTVLIASAMFGFAWAVAHTQMQHWMTDAVVRDRPVGTALFATSLFAGGAIGAAIGSAVASGGEFMPLFAATAVTGAVFAAAGAFGRARYRSRGA
jgi:predicted MFS family arabinose efflux permease